MSFAVGSLVKARGREWVVLPQSEEDFLILRPLGGSDEEITGISMDLENVESANFSLPDPTRLGDHRSCRLMRDSVRLGFRSSAGPFRSFGNLAVDPRPYQLVPLLMALRMDPVRLLIGDDVGIGKTIEASLIARELLDRGEIKRLTILCPPHLAEQWQMELREKFNIQAELVLASTAARLERACAVGESLFQIYPFTVVSLDFIKGERRRYEFINNCPEFVIVDEAHTCAHTQVNRGSRHQRYQLLKDLSANPDRPARRIAYRLAAVRRGEDDLSVDQYHRALRQVVSHCIYGVDINEMAVELCKINLWLESLEPGKPLSFLDHHIKCGNSLIGTTPAVMTKGIPDEAFEPIEGDNKKEATALKRQNRQEREGQSSLFGNYYVREGTDLGSIYCHIDEIEENQLLDQTEKDLCYKNYLASYEYNYQHLVADAWCAAFVWIKDSQRIEYSMTESILKLIQDDPSQVESGIIDEINRLARQYQFFHWHLAFPSVFSSSGYEKIDIN